jgi:hypothetical protein
VWSGRVIREKASAASAYFSAQKESLRVIRVEAHRLLDPVDALLRSPKPRQKLALLHNNEIVVGIQRERPFLMIRGLVMIVPVQV